jgi:hypothetical protein
MKPLTDAQLTRLETVSQTMQAATRQEVLSLCAEVREAREHMSRNCFTMDELEAGGERIAAGGEY